MCTLRRRRESSDQQSMICAVLIVLIVGAAGLVQAQSTNGQISGLVADCSQAALVGANVVATNASTGVTTATKTNESGVYVLPQLLPGNYQVMVTKKGFGSS